MKILVIGSFMMDLVVRSSRLPETGETIFGSSFSRFPGGKGANQAVAAARLGADVTMVGKVGTDSFGDEFLETMKKESIHSEYILRDETKATGVGSITVDENGKNRIVVVPGANLAYSTSDLDSIVEVLKSADILVMQLEMDQDVIEKAATLASIYHVPVILNPAPARPLRDELLKKITYLTPNETEAELLTGVKIDSIEDAKLAADSLLNKGVEHVIITLGEKGALVATKFEKSFIPGYSVQAIDTVAAGDSFNGALAVGIAGGQDLFETVKFANAVGALTVTKEGAIPSLPHLQEVQQFLKQQEEIA